MARFWGLLVLAALVSASTAQSLDWWQKTVFYQVYPRSFKDSDGDGVGDLNGITEKLQYFKDLGVDAFWISPFFKSPMADFGYDIANFTEVDPLFGTIDDFKALLAAAKALGLRVILDFVPNHTSDEHVWFVKSSNPADPEFEIYKDYYIWKDPSATGGLPNNWQSIFGGPTWTFNDARGQYYLHNFHHKQPDLNYSNPGVVNGMKDVLRFWLDLGIDGYRVDAIPFLFEDPAYPDIVEGQPSPNQNLPGTFDMVYQWRELLDEYTASTGSTKVMMTEAYADMPTMQLYQGDGTRNGSHFTFNFVVFNHNLNEQSTAKDFNDTVRDWLDNIGNHWSNWVVGNHDQHRVSARIGLAMKDAMNMFTLMLPGTAVTYYGEELGMEDNTAITFEQGVDPQGCQVENINDFPLRTRDFERTPMQWDDTTSAGFSTNPVPWLPVHENYLTLNIAAEQAAARSHWKNYRKLVDARQQPAVQLGSTSINYIDNVWGIHRYLDTTSFVVLINPSNSEQTVNVQSLFPGAPSTLQVYAVSVGSAYNEGDSLDSTSIRVSPKEGITLTGTTA